MLFLNLAFIFSTAVSVLKGVQAGLDLSSSSNIAVYWG